MDVLQTILPALVMNYVVQIPLFLAWLAGIVLSVVYWRRHPIVSLLTVIGLALFFLLSLVSTFLDLWLPAMLVQRPLVGAQIRTVLMARGIVQFVVSAVLWGLLITAIFGWRGKQGDK